jgi:hypothetical protein
VASIPYADMELCERILLEIVEGYVELIKISHFLNYSHKKCIILGFIWHFLHNLMHLLRAIASKEGLTFLKSYIIWPIFACGRNIQSSMSA